MWTSRVTWKTPQWHAALLAHIKYCDNQNAAYLVLKHSVGGTTAPVEKIYLWGWMKNQGDKGREVCVSFHGEFWCHLERAQWRHNLQWDTKEGNCEKWPMMRWILSEIPQEALVKSEIVVNDLYLFGHVSLNGPCTASDHRGIRCGHSHPPKGKINVYLSWFLQFHHLQKIISNNRATFSTSLFSLQVKKKDCRKNQWVIVIKKCHEKESVYLPSP